MTPLTQEALGILRERLLARCLADQADAQSAALIVRTQLEELDAGWHRDEYWHARRVGESTSQAWIDSLKDSHRVRVRKYSQARTDLAQHLSLLTSQHPSASFDERIVEAAVSAIECEMFAYRRTLSVKRRQNELVGEYGDLDNKRWRAEVRNFVTKNPRMSSAIESLQRLDSSLGLGIDWENFAISAVDRNIAPATDLSGVAVADGVGFEHACAAVLETCGWAVTITRTTGDQGVDLLAMKDGEVVAVQCKNTGQSVGNAAVQEVFAGKTFYEATAAVVVSRAGFTSSAIQLANRLEVTLVDSAELADFDLHIRRSVFTNSVRSSD